VGKVTREGGGTLPDHFLTKGGRGSKTVTLAFLRRAGTRKKRGGLDDVVRRLYKAEIESKERRGGNRRQ